jgi:hypothetical protein
VIPTSRPSPPLAERLSTRTRLFGALLVGAVIAIFLPLPWRLTGLGFGIAAITIGLRLLVALAQWRRSGGRGGGFIGVSVGLGLASVLIVYLSLEAAYYPVVRDRDQCMAQAPTLQAQQRCQDEFSHRLRPFAPASGSLLR